LYFSLLFYLLNKNILGNGIIVVTPGNGLFEINPGKRTQTNMNEPN